MWILIVRIFLCLLLTVGVNANPISYQQIDQNSQNQSSSKNSSPQSKAPDGGATPEFVRLADGRVVPFGPGIICTDECIKSDLISSIIPKAGGLNPWLIAIPVAAAGIIALVVLQKGSGSSTVILDTNTPQIVVPQPTPTPPQAEVPEPATLILLGIGLSLIARKGIAQKKNKRAA